jgi:hypothetical protein
MNDGDSKRPELVVLPTPIASESAGDVGHLAENRRLIVRRALLATAVDAAVPIPVLGDYFAGRVRAGMIVKLAERRRVDLAPGSADLLGDSREGSSMRSATMIAAALWALKRGWRKFFGLLAVGRYAEEMATSFQLGMLFDHYCAKVHVGAAVDRAQAAALRQTIFGALTESERQALVAAFRDGGRVLGKSFLEAPNWLSERIRLAAERWAESGGKSTDPDEGPDIGSAAEEARWVDRAAAAVEERIGRVEQGYLGGLVQSFERRWKEQAKKPKEQPPPERENDLPSSGRDPDDPFRR